MFSRLTVLIHCLPLVVYTLNSDLEQWIKIASVSCYSLALLAVLIIYSLQVEIIVTSGQAPVERLNVAYKFVPPSGESDDLNSEIKKISKQFPALKKIFFYYTTSDVVDLGCAGGIILSDEIANDAAQKKSLVKAGFQLLSTPPVSHAVFFEYPVVSWLPLTQWLACYRTYPRIHRYCEKHNLSAYPMVEVYDRKSVLFFAPLSRQDAFVVPEAEDIIARAKIKLEELEDEASGTEASNSEVSEAESDAESRESVPRSLSSGSTSLRSSVGSTASHSTTWSYYSSYDKFSDDEETEEVEQKREGFFRRSMSSCARTVKNMLGFSAQTDSTDISSTNANSTVSSSNVDNSSPNTSTSSVGADSTLVNGISEETPAANRSKSVNTGESKEAKSSLSGISRIVSALNLLGASEIPAEVANDAPSCATAVKLEIDTKSGAQCSAPCVQNNFQVSTVSFVGA